MIQSPTTSATLERRIGLRSAVLFNMLEMIGVGPFITLPLVIAAAGYRLSVWAWVLGAAIAVADGLVWAELGAAFPRAGGSYAFLREIYGPDRAGNWLSFLYVWQLSFSAPLSIASGCIGLSRFLAVSGPAWNPRPSPLSPRSTTATSPPQRPACCVTALLYRNLSSSHPPRLGALCRSPRRHRRSHRLRLCPRRGHWRLAHARTHPRSSAALALGGLAQATLITTYDYWGYYNITFLGSEVRRPERTIPRAILLSVLFVSAFYIAMNLAALPLCRERLRMLRSSAALRVQFVADIARSAFGRWAGYTMAALIVWTAFASVFSLLLGYSRVPYAAARDGNYFRFLAAVHPKHHIPHRSLIALGLVGIVLLLLLAHAGHHHARHHPHPAAVFSPAGRASSCFASSAPTCLAPSACRSTRCRRSPPWRDSLSSSSTAPTLSASSPSPQPSPPPEPSSISFAPIA